MSLLEILVLVIVFILGLIIGVFVNKKGLLTGGKPSHLFLEGNEIYLEYLGENEGTITILDKHGNEIFEVDSENDTAGYINLFKQVILYCQNNRNNKLPIDFSRRYIMIKVDNHSRIRYPSGW